MKLARGRQTPHVAIAGSQGPGCAHLKSTEMRKKDIVGLFPEVDLSLESHLVTMTNMRNCIGTSEEKKPRRLRSKKGRHNTGQAGEEAEKS